MDWLRCRSVEDTALGAAIGKHSAILQGYYDDPYIESFILHPSRKFPHQNLGSYLRMRMIKQGIAHFHSLYGPSSQVVVLGCGYDTMFWLTRRDGLHFQMWFDLDKPEVIRRKRLIISDNEFFAPLTNYVLDGIDFDCIENFHEILVEIGFQSLPTLFVDEFSLIYVAERSFDSILGSISKIPNSEFVSFGMTMKDSEFGKSVDEGFAELGIPLKSYSRTGTPAVAIESMTNYGFRAVSVIPNDIAVNELLSNEDKERIARLECGNWTCEAEEILQHYLTVYAGSPAFISIPFKF
jgi:O-methyltransferase involved in polyketide biosynthesis